MDHVDNVENAEHVEDEHRRHGGARSRSRSGEAEPGQIRGSVALVCLAVGTPLRATPEQQRELFARTLARERIVRDGNPPPTLQQIREVVGAYEQFVRRFPISGFSDNALWQAGNLSLLAYQRFGQTSDRRAGLRLLNQLKSSYPSSSLLGRYDETVAEFDAQPDNDTPVRLASKPAPPVALATLSAAPAPARSNVESAPASSVKAVASTGETVAIRAITRTSLADGVRVSIELDGEISYHQERLDNPRRVFFDLKGARPIEALLDATLKFPDDPVPEIRLGRHPQNTTRVVIDMRGADDYSVFTLYNPYRVVVDFHRSGAPVAAVPRLPVASPVSLRPGSARLRLESDSRAGDSIACRSARADCGRANREDPAPLPRRSSTCARRAFSAVGELERPVLDRPSTRAGCLAGRYRCGPRGPRSRRSREWHQRGGSGARRRPEASEAPHRTGRRGRRHDTRYRRLHPARGAYSRSPTGNRRTSSCRSTPMPAATQKRAESRPTSSTSPRTRKLRPWPPARTRPPARRCTVCRR